MVASLLKIVSTGVQDERLQPPKDQPDLGAFLTVIVKAGRYGTAWARIDFDTKPDFGQTAIIRIPTQGELVGRIMLVTQMPDIKTEQDKAYRARKVPKLYSNKYKDIELVEDFKYTPSYTTIYPQGASMAPLDPTPFTILRNIITTTGLSDGAVTSLFSSLGSDTAVIYGSSLLYAYKGVYTMGPTNMPVGDIDIAFRDTATIKSFAEFIYNSLGPDCIIIDGNGILQNESLRNNPNYYNSLYRLTIGLNISDTPSYKLISSSSPGNNKMGSLNIVKYYQNKPSWIHDAFGNISNTLYFNTSCISIYLPGYTSIQLVLCDTGLINGRTLAQYIQQTMDFTLISGTFDGTTLYEPYSTDIDTNIAVYTENIPVREAPDFRYRYDWMLYRLQKMIDRGFTIYFNNQQQINDWNAIPVLPPYWGDTLTSSTACPFSLVSTRINTPYTLTYNPNPNSITVADFSGVQLDDLLVGATYTINFSIPQNSPTTIFSAYLTDSGLNNQTFDRINEDTLILAAPSSEFLSYSYNGLNWNAITGPANLSPGSINKIVYDGSKWAAAGVWGVNEQGSIYSTNLSQPILQPSRKGSATNVAWNGTTYLAYGSWNEFDPPNAIIGFLSSSSDGMTWSVPYFPSIEGSSDSFDSGAVINSIMWAGSASKWLMTCNIVDSEPPYNINTLLSSLDGITWTPIGPTGFDLYPLKIAWNGLYGNDALYIAVGTWSTGSGNTCFLTSNDTITWDFQSNPGGTDYLYTTNAVDIVWTGYKWVAIGTWKQSQFNTLGEITTSSDGITWSNPFWLTQYTSSNGNANAISVNSNYIIVAGNWLSGTIVKSSGIFPTYAWINVIKPSRILIDIISINCINYSNGTNILAGGIWGDGTGTLLGTLSLSTDGGVTWRPPTNPQYLIDLNTTIGGYTNAISYNNYTSVFLAVGYWYDANNPATLSTICSTTDLFIWTGGPDPTGQTGVAYCITYSIDYPNDWWVGGSWADSGGNYLGSIASITLDGGGNVVWNNFFYITKVLSGTCYGIAKLVAGGNGTIVAVGQWNIDGNINKTISVTYNNGVIWNAPVNPTDPSTESEIDDPNAIGKCVTCLGPNTFIIGGTWKTSTKTYSIIYLNILTDDFGQQLITYQYYTDFPSITGTQIANSIAYNGQEYVAVGQWGNNTICTSEDAQTWTLPTNPNEVNSTGNVGTGVVYNSQNKNWVTVGSWASLPYNIVYANVVLFNYGVTWSNPFNPTGVIYATGGSVNSGKHVVWNPTTLQWTMSGLWAVSRGQSGNDIVRYVTNSSDGITWSQPYSIPQLINPTINGLFVKNSDTLFLGTWLTPNTLISSSSDGINWSYPIGLPGISRMFTIYKNGIKGNGTIWLTYGKFRDLNNLSTYNIFYSYDTVNWSPATVPSDILDITDNQSYVNGIAWTGSYWIAAGLFYNIATIAGIFSKSVDGITWSQPILPGNLTGYKSDTITWNGTIFVSSVSSIDENIPVNGSFIYSSDGINWSPPVYPINTVSGYSNNVVCNDIIWVAIGQWLDQDGNPKIISYSYDGITWNIINLIVAGYILTLSSISWNGSIWIIGGIKVLAADESVSSPIILTSFDGINWVENDNPPGQSSVTAIGTKRTLPYTGQQLFNPFIKNQSVTKLPPIILNPSANPPSYPTGSVVTWNSDPVYGNGTNYFTYLYNTVYFSTAGIIPIVNSPTFTFVATKRTQWLTFGTYYNLNPVQIILTLVNSAKLTVATDLVGPHFSWTNSLGHALINNVSLRIGGTLVDTIPGQLMEIIDEFQTPLERVKETSNLLCRDISAFNQSSFGTKTTGQIVTTPLPFWFSRGDPGCFLPIDALNIDEVRISVQFNPLTSLYYTDSRTTDTTGKIVQTNTAGAGLWPLAGSQFYYQDDDGSTIPGLEPYTTKGQKFVPFPNIKMPTSYTMPESYLMVEYIYLDKPEANRFRIADLQVPVVQHYAFEPVDNQNNQNVRIPLIVPNPTRDLFFYCNRYEAPGYNAPFLGTRDLSNNLVPQAPWWPNSTGLDDHYYGIIRPGYSKRYSEPLRWLSLDYAETLNRYSTENVGLFRSAIPSVEQRKAPFVNRYYYNLPLGIQNGFTPFSMPIGEANLDKVLRLNLTLGFHGKTGIINDSYVDRFITYTYAETYNIFRVYGGRGGMMFAY